MTSTKKNLNKEIIALFSGQSRMLTTPKLYVRLTGNHSLAIALNQCVFWSDKSDSDDGWFHKTYEEWFEEIHIPERTLRRRFEKLAELGWAQTKVKKVDGVNTLHIKPDMDKIIESIEILLDKNRPIRPDCPTGSESEPNTCTKVAPSGQLDRSETATLSGSSIYTDEKIHMSGGAEPPAAPFFQDYKAKELEALELACKESKKEKIEKDAINDERNIAFFKQKFEGYDVSIEDLFRACQEYCAPKGTWVGPQRFYDWIKFERLDKHSKKQAIKPGQPRPMSMFSPEELELLATYKHAIKYNMVDKFFTNPQRLHKAQEVYEQERTLIANNTRMQIDTI